jgi:hypothetical protein
MSKNVNANTYRVLGEEPERILSFYKWDAGHTKSLKEYITEYHGTTPTFIDPIFNRNGYYQNRKTGFTWIEVDGLAYTYKSHKSMFDYQLETLNQKVHSTREIAAMRELVKLNSLSPKAMQEIRQALYNNKNQYEFRMIGLSGLRGRKRFFAFKEKHNL